MTGDKIDFVIPWVDGGDPQWLEEKERYEFADCKDMDSNDYRYRDWENLQYWFRGVEKYAPWVNRVFFITYGHVPAWLNLNNPKLKIIKHTDYIPEKFLPTFSANPIELNIHRIPDLQEKFVFFNDDTFILNPLNPDDFFVDDKPCDSAILNVHCYDFEEMYILTPFIDIGVINRHFNIKDVLRENRKGWFSHKYGKYLLRNLVLMNCPRFPGILQKHLPNAFLKENFNTLWNLEGPLLEETCKHKFRHVLDVNQWLIKEWQIVSGNFYPSKVNRGDSMYAKDFARVCKYIQMSKKKFICINDNNLKKDTFIKAKEEINQTLQNKLPNKSSFEL